MKIDDIIDNWKQDAKMDEFALNDESVKIPQLHAKYLQILVEERMRMRNLENDLKKLKNWKSDYYHGYLNNPEDLKKYGVEPFQYTLTKNQIEDHVNSDEDVIKATERVFLQDEKIYILGEIMKRINNRQWEIKNSIDFQKFINGV